MATSLIMTLALLALLACPLPAIGQERDRSLDVPPAQGMVLDGPNGWRVPTLEDAVGALRGEVGLGSQRPTAPAIAILRQTLESRSRAELDEFARELANLIWEDYAGDGIRFGHARSALTLSAIAADDYPGVPYPGAYDQFVRIYEILVGQVLADGGTDPFFVADAGSPRTRWKLSAALADVYLVEPSSRGADYVLSVFEASEPPPLCDKWGGHYGEDEPPPEPRGPCPLGSTWCAAGNILMNAGVRGGDLFGGPPELPLADGEDWLVSEENVLQYKNLCSGGVRRTGPIVPQ